MKPYYQQTVDQVFEELKTSKNGLSPVEVIEHQEQYGLNELVQENRQDHYRFSFHSSRTSWLLS